MTRTSQPGTVLAHMALSLISMLRKPVVHGAARTAADWVDLQWSLMTKALRELAPRARGRMLDVGCGCRPYEEIFTPHVNEYVGLELEMTFSETAAASSPRQPDLYYDGKRIPFEDRAFDTVLSIQVLEHTPEPQQLLDEMARVLRPDGLMILSAPFCFRLHEEPHDYYRFSPHGLRHMCTRAGLELAELHPQGSLWSVLGHKLNSYLAFQVGGIGGLAQVLGRHIEEAKRSAPARWPLLPAILPAMAVISTGARILDRILPDRTEALSYLVVARRVRDVRT